MLASASRRRCATDGAAAAKTPSRYDRTSTARHVAYLLVRLYVRPVGHQAYPAPSPSGPLGTESSDIHQIFTRNVELIV
eukprot:scaffold119461_cov82-Phaeocystis_antarctica.AAC.4